MNLLKQILNDWKKGRQRIDQEKNKKMGWNLYDPGETVHNHRKRFYHVHYVWKYKFFIPASRIFARLMGKYLKKTIPDEPHNINIKLFHKAFEDSIEDWAHEYMSKAYNDGRDEKWANSFKKNYSCNTLRMMRDMMNTMLLYDSAYREFFNILAHKFTKAMTTHHTAEGTRDRTGHLFFTHGDIYDVDYYMLFKKVEIQRYMTLHNVDQEKYADERNKAEEEIKGRSS